VGVLFLKFSSQNFKRSTAPALHITKQFQITLYEKEILITTPSNRKEAYQAALKFAEGKSMHLIERNGMRHDWIETSDKALNYYECCGVLILFGISPPSLDELYSLLASPTVVSSTVSKAFHITDGAISRFALQKCSNLAQMLLANLLIARVIRWHGNFSRNLN